MELGKGGHARGTASQRELTSPAEDGDRALTSDSRSLRRPACEEELMDMIILDEGRLGEVYGELLLEVGL